MKKRIFTLILIALSLLALCSCGDDEVKMSFGEDCADYLELEIDGHHTVKVYNAPETDVKWSSADEGVAVVSPDGTVSATGYGITTITAMSGNQHLHLGVVVGGNEAYTDEKGNVVHRFDRESDITEITVGVAGGGKSDITIKKGDKFQLRAYTVPSNSKDKDSIVWKTDNGSVVKVDEKGVVQAVGTGKATVSAYAPNGVQGTIIIRSK